MVHLKRKKKENCVGCIAPGLEKLENFKFCMLIKPKTANGSNLFLMVVLLFTNNTI